MRTLFAATLCMLLLASGSGSGEPTDKSKVSSSETAQKDGYQEYVEVSRKDYPSLAFQIGTPVELVVGYHPAKNRQVTTEYYRSMIYRAFDYDRSGTARPFRSGKIVDVAVPFAAKPK